MFGFNNKSNATAPTFQVLTGGYNSLMVIYEGTVLKMAQEKDRDQTNQLINEGEIYSRLEVEEVEWILPNVKSGKFRGEPALFLPYIEGAIELGEFLIKNLDNLDELKSKILQIRAICRDLWDKDLYHGDLHLGNLIISPKGKVYIIDFGNSQFGQGTDREWFELVSKMAKSITDCNFPNRNGRKLFVWLEELNEIPLSQVINE